MHNAVHRFIIADDHPLFRGAMRQTIEKQFASVKIIEAGSLMKLPQLSIGRKT